MQAPGLHKIQYYNVYKTVITYDDDSNIDYLHRGHCTLCGKMTHKENLDQSKNDF